MKVCYFGIYNKNYSRNRIFISGLKQNDIKVLECHSSKKGLLKYLDLAIKHWKIRNEYDVLIVAFPGYQIVALAKLISRKKLVFDAFSSLYDSMVLDRKKVGQNSLKAKYYKFLDVLACKLADIVLLDTQENLDFFVDTFKLPKEKFRKILLGSDDSIFKPRNVEKKSDNFVVHFHGSNIALQGVEYILSAAKLLQGKNIIFNIIGSSIKKQYQDKIYSNITFIDDVEYAELGEYMNRADICLGIFGSTDKANRVIPNKVYEAMAVGVPIVTGRSKASQRLLQDQKNILFANMADSQDLADKILFAKNNPDLLKKISDNAYNLFKDKLTQKVIGRDLLQKIKNKIVVYTAIFGGKDSLKNPKFVSKYFDYICFSDEDIKSDVWQIKNVKRKFDLPRMNARYYKILAHKFLADYDISIWMDGNIVITKDINNFVYKVLENHNIAVFDHNDSAVDARNTVAEEAKVLLDMHQRGRKFFDVDKLKEQIKFYESEKFPDDGGLILSTVMFRRHNSADVIKAMERWWQQIERFSIRDQMGFNYAAWKENLNFKYIKGDLRNHSHFKWLMHKHKK